MTRDTVSVECAHKVCSACTFEDCACECHISDSEAQEDFEFVPTKPKQMTIQEVYGSIEIK